MTVSYTHLINERFYWDSTEDLLVYALPDQIVYADAETKGSNGAPLLLVKDDEVYLTLGLIANYTDVQIQTFDSGDGRRVLINDWGTRNIARVKKAGSLRVKGEMCIRDSRCPALQQCCGSKRDHRKLQAAVPVYQGIP